MKFTLKILKSQLGAVCEAVLIVVLRDFEQLEGMAESVLAYSLYRTGLRGNTHFPVFLAFSHPQLYNHVAFLRPLLDLQVAGHGLLHI